MRLVINSMDIRNCLLEALLLFAWLQLETPIIFISCQKNYIKNSSLLKEFLWSRVTEVRSRLRCHWHPFERQ